MDWNQKRLCGAFTKRIGRGDRDADFGFGFIIDRNAVFQLQAIAGFVLHNLKAIVAHRDLDRVTFIVDN